MRLVQQLEGAYVRRMRRAVPKPGRPCTICGHAKRVRIEAAVTAGTSLRTISQSYRVSRSAIQRHQASHIQRAKALPTAAKVPPPLGRTLAYDASGNIIIDGFGRVTYADAPLPSGGQSTSMTLGGSVGGERAGEHLHQPRWWGGPSLAPRSGARCSGCGGAAWRQGDDRGWSGCVICAPLIKGKIFET
jgi:hypothetical protein